MKKYQIHTKVQTLIADDLTPVAIYQSIRDHFGVTGIMESNDMRSTENCFSFILAEPIATFTVIDGKANMTMPDGETHTQTISRPPMLETSFQFFMDSFNQTTTETNRNIHGVFGFSSFECCRHYDAFDIHEKDDKKDLVDMRFDLYRYIMAFNHLTDRLYICCNMIDDEDFSEGFNSLMDIIASKRVPKYPFSIVGEERADTDEDAYMAMIEAGKRHCQKGDVFQIVLSRAFQQDFKGDEFNVYRALRSINPSPYLFYFNFDRFKIFGSSPESQLIIDDHKATLHPIAGTYKRTGNDFEDEKLALELLADPKENAEHIMLVDLARNDLGRHSSKVVVSQLKETKYYSHVIHLVSQVDGVLPDEYNPLTIFADTFPAGTLSGAPKIKAVSLIDHYEKTRRGYYGGAIGFIGFNGDINTAIIIRSFFSLDYTLHFRAGAGVVISSVPAKELAEVDNKVAALRQAIGMAESMN